MWVLCFQLLQMPKRHIVFGIADAGFIQLIVFAVVAFKQMNQFVHLLLNGFIGHVTSLSLKKISVLPAHCLARCPR